MTIFAVIPARQRCGVSDYAGHLYSGAQFETGGIRLKKVPLNFWNCLKIPFAHADIVHLQHEYSIYGFAGCWGFLLFCYLLLLRLTGSKLVVTLHTIYNWDQAGQIFAHRTKSRLLIQTLRLYGKIYHRLILLAASRVIFLSEGSKAAFVRIAPWADPKKLTVIPIGVYDLPIRDRNTAALGMRHGIKPGEYVFTLFGFAFPNKGYHLAIEALKILQAGNSDLKLLIVSGEPGEGGAQYLASLKEMMQHFGLEKKVIFTGFIPFDDPLLDEILLQTNCFLYPYLKESATSGSLATTLAARKIYITSDLEMFRDFTPGIKFRAGDVGDLAAKMLQVRQMNSANLTACQDKLQIYLSENNTEAMRKRHLDCFVQLLEKSPSKSLKIY
ncbi:MAG TPA: glycosyltransferase family 4 protein [Verrucomicrobiae bacterium]|jgi:glycosyltransferase involved in cell wall biosynthesis|nr:glycosyltransferase family 4 protein [Verrucomicrobiae bacterium]